MNLEQARFNMVEQQIRTWDVLDQRVLELISGMDRDAFVPEAYRRLAYADINVPLGNDQVMMTPKLEARMLQELRVQPGDRALEIGTGSGYVTALLARLADHVYSVEVSPELSGSAEARLAAHGVENATLHVGDGVHGWPYYRPYDVIAVTGSMPVLAPELQQQLAVGGRLFVVVGESPAMEALLITRAGESDFHRESLFDTDLPALEGAPQPERFVF